MAVYLNTPPIFSGDEKNQLSELRSYVFQVVETLNNDLHDMNAEGILKEIEKAVSCPEDEEDRSIIGTADNIKSLIIKTADFALGKSERFKKILKSEYSASSDFGETAARLENEINAASDGITQLFRYTEGIRSDFGDFSTTSEQYIKTGLLFNDENNVPVYGVGIGNLSTKVTADGKTVLSREKLLTTTTADEIAFWNHGKKVAYISADKMHFPSGTLEAKDAIVSGEINATSGTIGGCTIENGVLKISDANIGSIDAGKIKSGTLSTRNISFDSLVSIVGRDGANNPFVEKGIFGYETESIENAERGLLLETADGNKSLFLGGSKLWFGEKSSQWMKMLLLEGNDIKMFCDEDYERDRVGNTSRIRVNLGNVSIEHENRDATSGLVYIRVEDDDIKFRTPRGITYLSEILDACGL